MATDEKSMAEIRTQQEKQGGVIPSKLAHGQSVLVETENYMFNLTKQDGHWFLESAHPMAQTIKQVVGITSYDKKSGFIMDDWIGKDMMLTLISPYGTALITRHVQSAVVSGEGFEVNVWD